MKKFVSFILRPIPKILIQSILTLWISIATAVLGSFDTAQNNFSIKIFVLAFGIVLEIVYLIISTTKEVNLRRVNVELKKQLTAFKMLGANVIKICDDNSKDLNDCIKNVHDKNVINLKIWDFDRASKTICRCIYEFLRETCNNEKLEVAYVRRVYDKENEVEAVRMNAYANLASAQPTIFDKVRPIESSPYHDARLFLAGKSDIEALTHDEISKSFYNRDPEKATPYNQYIAVPIVCNNKIIGLLEVVSLGNTVLGITKDEIEELANRFLVPYSRLFLLLHKTERALLLGTKIEKR